MRTFTTLCGAMALAICSSLNVSAADETTVSLNLADHIGLTLPNSLEANPINTKTSFGIGMAIYELAVDNIDIKPATKDMAINLKYSATEDGETKTLATINPNDGGQVAVMSIGQLRTGGIVVDDDYFPEFPATTAIYLLFNADASGAPAAAYTEDGYYFVEIPDGAFTLGGQDLKGLTLRYHYLNEIPKVDIEYTLTPSSGSEVISTDVFMNTGIRVAFPKASSLDYKKKGGGSLVGPNDLVIEARYPQINYEKCWIDYKFGFPGNDTSEGTVWVDGQYTFSIAKGFLLVDAGYFEDEEEGNFDGLTATYILKSGSVEVSLVGIEAAESYDVYTLDGKAVALGLAPEAVSSLENGLYIINGKKVILRK